jgi:hypothetical protein
MKERRTLAMNHRQKHLFACLLALAALLCTGPMQAAWAGHAPKPKSPALGAASPFALLGATVTCTRGAIIGDVGALVAYTNTTCPIAGDQPPATNEAAALADSDFLATYDALIAQSCINQPGSLVGANLPPGVYCLDGTANTTGTLTLTGPSNGVWIFLSTGALTGTDFTVTLAGGGQACNVWWAPDGGTTFTTSVVQGNILAGDATNGSITLTGGALLGRALANIAVTTTDATVIVPAAANGCPKK